MPEESYWPERHEDAYERYIDSERSGAGDLERKVSGPKVEVHRREQRSRCKTALAGLVLMMASNAFVPYGKWRHTTYAIAQCVFFYSLTAIVAAAGRGPKRND